MDRLLSDKEVLKIIGKKARLMTYPELANYTGLKSLFGNDDKIVLLYVNKSDGINIEGHWCLLTRYKKGKKIIIEFTDPYGMMPDEQLKFYSKRWRRESGQDNNYLTRFLYDASLNPNVEIHYNELPVQKDGGAINTCGRHIGLRGKFYKVPLEKYQQLFKNLQNNGIDLDKAVVKLTDNLL